MSPRTVWRSYQKGSILYSWLNSR